MIYKLITFKLSFRSIARQFKCDQFVYHKDKGDLIYKLITFKLSFRSIARLLFLFMALNRDLNMKAKKARTFLYFQFLIFCLRYILLGI